MSSDVGVYNKHTMFRFVLNKASKGKVSKEGHPMYKFASISIQKAFMQALNVVDCSVRSQHLHRIFGEGEQFFWKKRPNCV